MHELTGQCKQDFLIHYGKSEVRFNSHSLKYKNKLMIDFFKLKDISITFNESKLGGCLLYFSNEFEEIGIGWNLQDIQEKCIFRANKIYNETRQKIN